MAIANAKPFAAVLKLRFITNSFGYPIPRVRSLQLNRLVVANNLATTIDLALIDRTRKSHTITFRRLTSFILRVARQIPNWP
jgi:hypothetical protein